MVLNVNKFQKINQKGAFEAEPLCRKNAVLVAPQGGRN